MLFLEALSAVRNEREQDYELLQLCREGSARGSMKMRAACLQAQADRASPVVLKAVLRAVSIAWRDFSDSVSSPGKLAIVVLFVLSSLFLPVSAWVRALMQTDFCMHSDGTNGHVVVLAHQAAATLGRPRLNFKRRVQRALRLRGRRSDSGTSLLPFPRITEVTDDEEHAHDYDDNDDDDCLVDVDLSGSGGAGGRHLKWE